MCASLQSAASLAHSHAAARVSRAIRSRLRSLDPPQREAVVEELTADLWLRVWQWLHSAAGGDASLSLSDDEAIELVEDVSRYALALVRPVVADYWRVTINHDQQQPTDAYADLERVADPISVDEPIERERPAGATPEELAAELPEHLVDLALYLGWVDASAVGPELAAALHCTERTITRQRAALRSALAQRMVADRVCRSLDCLLITW